VQNPDRDQHYGQSELREAYRSWYSKDIIIRFYNIFMERMASGFFELKPSASTVITKNSEEYRSLRAILDHMQSTTGILLPSGVDLTVHAPKTTDQFEKAISMHDLQIAKALLVPNLLGISHTGQTGSFSQSETQLEAFLWTLDADALRLEDAINEQLFDPLSELNFADGIGPRFKFKPVSSSKKHEIIKVWLDLVTAGAVEASDADEEHIRKLMDFPDKGEPLDINVTTQNPEITDPNAQPRSQRPTDGEPRTSDENFVSRESFNRALRRVAISVIDRKSNDILDNATDVVSERIDEMLAGVSLDIIEHSMGTPAATKSINDLKFDARERNKIRKAMDTMLQQAWDLGTKHARDEISKARKETFKVNMARLGDGADEFLKSNAFRVVGDLSDDMLQFITVTLASAVKFSWTPEETVRKIYDRLTTEGFVHIETNAEVTGRAVADIREQLALATGTTVPRIRSIIRNNLFESMNEARYNIFTDPDLADFIEALQYSAILDSRTTPVCRHMHRRVYPKDSPVWDKWRPQNHFNCRSILVPVTVVDDEVVGKDSAPGSRYSRPPTIEPQQGFGG
jgi:SPP1 gp7 family putative phage head morphogenesis protein